MNKKFILLLSTAKGLCVLKSAVLCGASIRIVVIAKDRKVQNDYSSEIINICLQNSIKFTLDRQDFNILNEDIIIAVSWKWIIKCPIDRLLVFHDSLLPNYRGFAPLVNMLINGEKNIGGTVLLGGTNYDTGRIVAQKSIINFRPNSYE